MKKNCGLSEGKHSNTKIFEPKMNEEDEFKVRTNKELSRLYGEANIIGIMKNSRIRLAGHVWSSEGTLGSITNWRSD